MKFFIILALVGAAFAAFQMDPAKRTAITRLISMEATEMTLCHSNNECTSIPNKPKCDMMLHLCRPTEAPTFDLITGTCTSEDECPPLYDCHQGKCHFTGPKFCQTNQDCLQGVQGVTFECVENMKSAPGKRCWEKCTTDTDCFDRSRLPEEIKMKIGCCKGYCQKKTAC